MEGYFQSPFVEVVDHPDGKVRPGERVRLRAHYWAYAPGQPWYAPEWTVSVVVYKAGDSTYKIYGQNDTTHLTSGPIEHSVDIDMGTMPSTSQNWMLVLWGNETAWRAFPEDGGNWQQLDLIYFTVQVDTSPEYEGTISNKVFEYDSQQGSIPVSDVPFDKRGICHIYGRNDTDENQKMGIEWWVRDPDGRQIEHYTDWELTWTGPGNAQHFIGGRFDLDKVGNWTLKVNLLMNPTTPTIVDTYNGRLCTVLPEEVEYEGSITRKELNYEDDQRPIPVSGVPYDKKGIVYMWGRNESESNQKLGFRWTVKDPNGTVRESGTDWETFWTAPGNAEQFHSDDFRLAFTGDWTVKIEFLMNPDNPIVVDSYEGRMCTVLPEAAEYAGTITRKELEYDSYQGPIPIDGVPIENRGLVHIWGRNDTDENQKMGIAWEVKDPDNITLETYSAFETIWTGPGNAQHFIGGRFDMNKPGQYRITVVLLENPDNPIEVDSFDGVLCTVTSAGLAGTITEKELEYNGSKQAMPASAVPQGNEGRVHVYGRNDTSHNQKMGIEWTVRDPGGGIAEQYSYFETFWTQPGNAQHFVGDKFLLDQMGVWSISIRLLIDPDTQTEVDTFEGEMCEVSTGGPGGDLFGNLVATFKT